MIDELAGAERQQRRALTDLEGRRGSLSRTVEELAGAERDERRVLADVERQQRQVLTDLGSREAELRRAVGELAGAERNQRQMLAELATQREAEVLEIADLERRRDVVAAATAQVDARQESVRRSLLDLERDLVQAAARSSDQDEAPADGGVSDTGGLLRTAGTEKRGRVRAARVPASFRARAGAEALADRVARDLAGRGVPVADVRAVGFGIGVSRIRYFFGNEATAAPAIGAMVAGSLGAGGGSAPEVQDFTHFEPKPSPGTIEVWVTGAGNHDRPGS